MPVPTSLNDLSTTPASNYPAGSDSPSVLDDTLRAHAALIATLRDLNNTGPQGGLRNLIINGNFAINQRGYVSGAAVGAANTYTLDRWRVVTAGQLIHMAGQANGNLVEAPAGGLEQVIEGASIAGGTYVINWTGTATCTVGGTARAKGATFTLTANANVTVRFSGGTVGNVQVEPGTVVTPFEARPYGLELMLCQRYYEVIRIAWVMSGVQTPWYNYRQAKRAAPTATYTYDSGGTGGAVAAEGHALIQTNGHSVTSNGSVWLSAEL